MDRISPRAETIHSRIVRLAKLILPTSALVLLSTMFLLARGVNPDRAIPIAEVDVPGRARDQQLTRPRFTGLSARGTAFDLSASLARPDAADPHLMSAERLRLVLEDGTGRATVISDAGEIDTAERRLVLDGDVRIETSTGYRLLTDRLTGTFGRLDIAAPGEVTGNGPLGDLRAGSMTIGEDETGAVHLVFRNGVDLLYIPPS